MSRRLLRSVAGPTAAVVAGYLAGTFPSAHLVSHLTRDGIDPARDGSGNPGAANVAGLLGRRAGAAVFMLDAAKAFGAGRLGAALAGATGANVAAAAAVLGHCHPATRGFRGGKGVAASFGQMLATFPIYLPVDVALGAVAARSDRWKRRPIATIAATCGLWTTLAALWERRGLPNPGAPAPTAALPLAAAASSVVIIGRFAAEARAARPDGDPVE